MVGIQSVSTKYHDRKEVGLCLSHRRKQLDVKILYRNVIILQNYGKASGAVTLNIKISMLSKVRLKIKSSAAFFLFFLSM